MKEEVRSLWKRCFDDSDEFIEMYFRLRYQSETTVTLQNGGTTVSSLQMPYYPMTFEGTEIQTSYISGACTHPDFRGKGIMTQLLADAFSRMVQKDVPLSILIPANPGLYDYYARTGYAPAFFRSRIEQSVSDISAMKADLHFEHTTDFSQSLFDYFKEQAACRPNYVQHTAADLEAVMEDLRLSGGSATMAYRGRQKEIKGLLFAYPEGDYLKVTECFADNEGIRDNLIREAATHHGVQKVVRFELPRRSSAEQVFGMARIINARTILDIYAAAHPEAKIDIALTDEQLGFNNGHYHIHKGKCTFGKEPRKSEYTEMSTQQLSAMIFDKTRLYMSLMLE